MKGSVEIVDISAAAIPMRLTSAAAILLALVAVPALFGIVANLAIEVVDRSIGISLSDIPSVSFLVAVIFLFCFVGWRQNGRLGSYGDVLAFILWFLIAIVNYPIVFIARYYWDEIINLSSLDKDSLQGLLIILTLSATGALLSTISIVGLLWGRWVGIRLPISVSGTSKVRLGALFKSNRASVAHGFRRKFVPPARPLLGTFALFFAISFAGLLGIVPDRFSRGVGFTIIVNIIFYWIIAYARKQFQPSLDAVLGYDARPPVLFLRSFADERRRYKWYKWIINRDMVDFSLEWRLAGYFSYLGGFVAIGSPDTSGIQLGAARAILSDEEWQDELIKLMESCQVIVMMIGLTKWTAWELQQSVASNYFRKLIMIFPEERNLYYDLGAKGPRLRIQGLSSALKGSRWEQAINSVPMEKVNRFKAVVLGEDGSIQIVASRSRSRDMYCLSAVVAHHLALHRTTAISAGR